MTSLVLTAATLYRTVVRTTEWKISCVGLMASNRALGFAQCSWFFTKPKNHQFSLETFFS